ncbi:MFS general substrate transporter [Guyanagaster necrorhizus]|uniref:MFS general substrate transporter n=1 Tax=Guyanagaster necrorhizus TaxID=856835 RepID=A0A9P8ARN6_9AGAR|nr:MFS general substrate transporter [Guyanagaster necrorhizus MCA 3950]KAG7444037.1 MFS general substrate transporter [Guyanagaster necrorhizus MCA 3950]
MVRDIFRDSTIGQAINHISNGRIFPYAEQRPAFQVPLHFLPVKPPSTILSPDSDAITLCNAETPRDTMPRVELTRESTLAVDVEAEKHWDSCTVGWYSDDDQDNPRNWSPAKRAFVAFCISFLTFSVYIGSAIYTPSIPGLMIDFNVSQTTATLGLTLYVLAYGIGPMFLAPLQEIPSIGRNLVYMATLFLFIIFQIPIVMAKNMSTVLAFRFLTGFVSSPALATGGASMTDIYPVNHISYVLGIWALGGVAGPILGPVIGGFAAQANGWRWPQYELIWIVSFALIFLLLLLPETYGPTILLKRARRLRKLTRNQQLRSQSEKDLEGESFTAVMKEALIRPFILAKEPVLMFSNLYIGFVYAIFYLWFEAFPLVFTDIYHFRLGISDLPFLGFIVSAAITYAVYVIYLKYRIAPLFAKARTTGVDVLPEIHLEIGLMASIFIPTSLLIFGFTAKESIHWIFPVIGAALYHPGIYFSFQSILTYVTCAYPAYAASVLAGNTLFRSTVASVFPLFGRAFFLNLGLGPGSALLAGISFLLIPVFWSLWKWGPVLRRRSVYAFSS